MPVSASLTRIAQGGTIYIGEEGLDISGAVGSYNKIAWWASAAMVSSTSPVRVLDISNKNSFLVTPQTFVGYTGNWYVYNGSIPPPSTTAVLYVQDPSLDVKVWDLDTNTDVSGKSVPQGERLTFRIDTNMYAATYTTTRPDANPATDGFITIKVKNENGALLESLYDTDMVSRSLLNQYVNVQPYTWSHSGGVNVWGTGLMDSSNQYIYPVGTYTVSAESGLNNMKTNYKNAGADYTGKTVSQTYTITLVTPSLNIQSNKDSVIRSKAFSVTITGKPSTSYYLWVRGTGGMTGASQDRPPVISLSQAGVTMDPETGPFTIGSYAYTNGGGATLRDDIPPSVTGAPNNRYYAQITTSTSGIRTVEFQTTSDTKPDTYYFKVETTGFSDVVPVQVQKGAVTIAAAGSQSYNRGEIIHFSGTNTETVKTYLFIDNYAPGGTLTNPPTVVTNNNAATFDSAIVLADNTWSYDWDTAGLNLPGGTYTIYAVSFPYDKNNIGNAAYGSLAIGINSTIAATSTTSTTTTTTTTTTATTTAATTAVTTTPATTVVTTAPTTSQTNPVTTVQTAATARTTKQTLAEFTPWETSAPAPESAIPPEVACLALVIGAGAVLWKRG